ncbi:MAG TPA: hypothetical protein VFE42_15320 [Chloroflexota bacterium]|nr:hypothetical protein [Chloroflexota bacterium]
MEERLDLPTIVRRDISQRLDAVHQRVGHEHGHQFVIGLAAIMHL